MNMVKKIGMKRLIVLAFSLGMFTGASVAFACAEMADASPFEAKNLESVWGQGAPGANENTGDNAGDLSTNTQTPPPEQQ